MSDEIMPIGHPCSFARPLMSRPGVRRLVERYNALMAEERRCVAEGDCSAAWGALLEMKRLEEVLSERCEREQKLN